jgi:hypothetical protein
MEKNWFPGYNIHCTFKMINTRRIPYFSVKTDFNKMRIIIIPPSPAKIKTENFLNWLFNDLLKTLPVKYSVDKKWIRNDRIIITSLHDGDSQRKKFRLISKILDRLLTGKKNHIFLPYSFCLVE